MLDRRTYRHPTTGEKAHLTVDRVTGPGGQRWWFVALVQAVGDRNALDGYSAIEFKGLLALGLWMAVRTID